MAGKRCENIFSIRSVAVLSRIEFPGVLNSTFSSWAGLLGWSLVFWASLHPSGNAKHPRANELHLRHAHQHSDASVQSSEEVML